MNSKKWWQSKGIWAGVFTTALGVVGIIDANFGTDFTHTSWYATAVAIGGTMGLYGRKTANSKIE